MDLLADVDARPGPSWRRTFHLPSDMTSDLDIYRSANLLVKRHGEDAPIQAAMRADELLDAGDLDGAAVFKRILKALRELDGTAPGPGVTVH